jgi:uncharacterized membrane protein YtjA (UPF0391 family)
MLGWSMTFFVIAFFAAVLGFGGLAAGAAGIAKFLFFLFVAMAIVSFAVHVARRP